MIACENSGHSIPDDFPEVRKIVEAGVTTNPKKDYELSRYACYLIVQNGDPRKEVIALGQTYFAIQTHRQEVADHFNELDEDNRRLVVRGDIKQWNQMLAETAHNAGVITNEEFAIFQNAGYMGLYGGLDVEGILAAVYQSVFGGDVYLSLEEKVLIYYLMKLVTRKLFNGECMKKRITLIVFSVLIIVALYVLYCFNYIPHKKYTNADFNIEAYKSNIDKDNDGIDDQTDILNNANNYIKTNPKYKSKYYNTGYPNDEYGVCTDVVAFALKDAGYDLMVLVNEDIKNNKALYDIDAVDKNIDFRRVKNLKVYFDNNAISLTTDINEIEEWQGGDIVVFKKHIGIISDKRNRKGICFVIHHANPYQIYYEEDILEHRDDIIGHYRIS